MNARAKSTSETVRRSRALARARRLPHRPVPVVLRRDARPLVSIVVPVHDQWRYTNACLRALAAASDPSIAIEVIVVDDASTDRSGELLKACTGIRIVRLDQNGGFGAACNAGAAQARGTYLHFLNNDAFVSEGWLQPLLDAFDRDAGIAAAVSQLRYLDETLAEAGGVLWRDARGSNYGRGDSPSDWRYRTLRDVDYGSAASLMVARDAFERAGGFSAEFAPAYYEDADLCFALRAGGGRVVYQPRSIVYHVEGASYGSNRRKEAGALQERSREAFARKWADVLRDHFAPDAANVDRAARRLGGSPTIVIVDEHVPFTDRDAGSRRIAFLIELLRERGRHVVFGSVDASEYEPYTSTLRECGVDVTAGLDARAIAAIGRLAPAVAWLCRPLPAARFGAAFQKGCGAKVVFDTVDLHWVRLQREQRLNGGATKWQAMRELELTIARSADATVTTSETERRLLVESGVDPVYVLPVIEPAPQERSPGWNERSGVVFLGNYAHAPNVDAVRWLCEAIMPLVWQSLPHLTLVLAGADPTRAVRALARGNVAVTGHVADAAACLATRRVFAAPLRFGAGVKGKIVYAMACGIPVVTTAVGSEGIATADEYAAFTTPEELAAQIVRLHEDRGAWEAHVAAGSAIATRFTPAAAASRLDALLAAL